MYILGAGLAGCLAAIRYPNSVVIEAGPMVTNHRAILRMQNDSVSKLTGIEFKKVLVRKFIGLGLESRKPTLGEILSYSIKTNGGISSRSITNIQDEYRFIPPNNFHQVLSDRIAHQVNYNQNVVKITKDVISTDRAIYERSCSDITTIPLNAFLKISGISLSVPEFRMEFSPIFITEFKIDSCDIYATVYLPEQCTNIYRISFTGDILTIESIKPINSDDIDLAFSALGLSGVVAEPTIMNHKQNIGKLIPISDSIRKDILYQITSQFNVYSLGRFACWRNILLDDVVNDITKINRMINIHPYERSLA